MLRGALVDISRVEDGPDAARARRDAVVLLLLLDRQLSRRQALRARARSYPVLGIDAHDYPIERDARACRACALSRWLRTLAHARLAVDEPRVARTPDHDCIYAVPDGWTAGPLLPEISRWGQVQAHSRTGLSTRALTQILQERTADRGALSEPADDVPRPQLDVPPPLPPTMTVAEAARRRRQLREELGNG